ncbi:MAG: hypothetical protein GY761_04820 [Hyphomicrobiales bacterium]|nr:hypothetical protein [Hyphomicrobiales bacterium]
MTYEPFDALYWSIQLGAERSAMPSHRVSVATTLMGLYRAPALILKPLKQFDNWAVRNCPTALLNRAYGALAPLRTIRPASEQFRIGQMIHMSSKVFQIC